MVPNTQTTGWDQDNFNEGTDGLNTKRLGIGTLGSSSHFA